MQITLRQRLEQFSHLNQTILFSFLEERFGVLSDKARLLVSVLGMLSLHRYIAPSRGWRGRPSKDRLALATAFLAKAVLGIPTTRQLVERLQTDRQLRCLCGWNDSRQIPHEATFSRAFSEFADTELPQQLHAALIEDTQANRLIGHIARDSTAMAARESSAQQKARRARDRKRQKKAKKKAAPRPESKKPVAKRKRGRPRKTERALPNRRMLRQLRQTLPEMLSELPTRCDSGGKKDSQGHTHYWRGYKLHLDVADGQIPISCLLTSASMHDSQAAIPLATITAGRVTSLYDLMDCAYDADAIHSHSRSLGHVPVIAPRETDVPITHRTDRESQRGYDKRRKLPTKRKSKRLPFTPAQEQRYQVRSMIERVNGRLKDEFGGRTLRVRGASKVMAHLMFGIVALTVDQLLRLAG